MQTSRACHPMPFVNHTMSNKRKLATGVTRSAQSNLLSQVDHTTNSHVCCVQPAMLSKKGHSGYTLPLARYASRCSSALLLRGSPGGCTPRPPLLLGAASPDPCS